MTKRTTDQWEALLDSPRVTNWPWSPMDGKTPLGRLLTERHEAITELVLLRRELKEFIGELHEDLAHEGIETYEDISDAWPSMQEYGECTVKLAHRNILTRILEGDNDE